MGENKSNQNNSKGPLIATIIVAVAAIAAIVILLITLMPGKENENSTASLPDGTQITFRASQELVDECRDNAHDLVANNFEVIKLFITQGLPHLDEPYGNLPEDGVYTVNSDKYKTMDDIENFLKSIYTDDAVKNILDKNVYRSRLTKDGVPYMGTESDSPDVEKVLGINASFKADKNYGKDWTSCFVEVTPISETECHIAVYVNGTNPDDESIDSASVIESTMVKTDDKWKLSELLS